MSAAANPRDMSLAEAIRARRSVRRYAARPIDLSRLSRLLEAGQGITGADGKRATPSAHGLYPLALFVVAGNVDGLASGLHRYMARILAERLLNTTQTLKALML